MAGGTVVGLDVGSQLIKVVELRRSGSGVEVTALDLAPTPQEAMDNGLIIDAQLLGKAVKDLLGKAHVTAKRCVSSVSGQAAVVVRVLEVPQVADSELANQMQFEAERQVPFSLSESIMDFCPIPRAEGYAEGEMMEVLLAVAQSDLVDKHVEMLFAAGLKPDAIDVEPIAIGRALLEVGSVADIPGHTVAIVNIGASNTDISIFRDKLLSFPRIVPIAGDNLTRAIADYMQVDLVTAEQYKREYGEVLMDQLAAPSTFTGQTDTGGFTGGGFTDFSSEMAPPSANMPFDFSSPGAAPSFTTEEQSAFSVPGATPQASPFDFASQGGGTSENTGTSEQAASGTSEQGGTGTSETQMGTAETMFGSGFPSGFQTMEAVPTQWAPPTGELTGTTSDAGQDTLKIQVFNCMAPVLAELLSEVRRSLDYYRGRNGESQINEVLLVGGSANIKNLATFVEQELGIPTRVANPLQGINVTSKNYSPDHLSEIATLFPISIGLGARDLVASGGGKKRR
jgi:type IV pilus assembly protein PilM